MKTVAIVEANKVELLDVPMPEVGPDEVLVKIDVCLLCTWEQRIFTRLMKFPLPFFGGHEMAGTIAAVGSNVDAEKFPIGATAVVGIIAYCRQCSACRRGATNLCQTYTHGDPLGGLSEYVAVSSQLIYMTHEPVSSLRMAFTEPLGCVITGFDKLKVGFGDDVVVIGGGMMGLLNALVAKQVGARVIVSEVDENRRELARTLGVDTVINPLEEDAVEAVRRLTYQKGAEVVINTITAKTAVNQCLDMLCAAGTFMMFGKMFPDGNITIDINQIHDNDLHITGSMSSSDIGYQQAIHMLEKGLIRPEEWGLLTAVYEKEEAQKAFEEAIKPETYRIGIRF